MQEFFPAPQAFQDAALPFVSKIRINSAGFCYIFDKGFGFMRVLQAVTNKDPVFLRCSFHCLAYCFTEIALPSPVRLNKAGISSLLRPRRNRSGSWCHGGYIQIPFLPSAPAGAAYPGTCVPTPGLRSSHPLIRHRYFLP